MAGILGGYGTPGQGGGILGGGQVQPPANFGGGGFLRNNSDLLMSFGGAMLGANGMFGQGLANFGQMAPAAARNDRKRNAANIWLKAKSAGMDPATLDYIKANPDLAEGIIAAQITPHPLVVAPPGSTMNDAFTGEVKGGAQGGYYGSTMDAQNWNILLNKNADPSSPEYAAAYAQVTTPKMVQGQDSQGHEIVTPVTPNIPPSIRPPTYAQQGQGASPQGVMPQGAPGAAPAQGGVGQPMITGTKAPNEQQTKNRQLYHVAKPDLDIVEQNFSELSNLVNQGGGMLPDGASQLATSAGYQRAYNAIHTIASSYLYSTSGATANPNEVKTLESSVMPAPFEAKASVADKMRRIQTMVEAIRMAGQTNATLDAPPGAAQAPPPAQGAASQSPDGIVTVTSPAEAIQLPPGTQFRTPDGRLKVRP